MQILDIDITVYYFQFAFWGIGTDAYESSVWELPFNSSVPVISPHVPEQMEIKLFTPDCVVRVIFPVTQIWLFANPKRKRLSRSVIVIFFMILLFVINNVSIITVLNQMDYNLYLLIKQSYHLSTLNLLATLIIIVNFGLIKQY